MDETGGGVELLEREHQIERSVNGHMLLPGGRWLIYADCEAFTCGQESEPRIVARDLQSGETVPLLANASQPRVVESGHLMFVRDGTVFAVPFDGTPGTITERPIAVPGLVPTIGIDGTDFAVARNGTMVYVPSGDARLSYLVLVNRTGTLEELASRPNAYAYPRVDPTGTRIAVTVGGTSQQIWMYDIGSSTLSQFTVEGSNERATWSPDGRELAFSSLRNGVWSVYRRPANASAPATPLDTTAHTALRITPNWSPDGDWVVTDQLVDTATTDEIIALSTTGEHRRALVATPSRETVPDVSPDGRWLAYVSDESGSEEVYVTPFMAEGGRWQVSDASGDMPRWLSNDELVYIASDQMLTQVELDVTDGIRVLNRTSLFSVEQYRLDGNAWPYHIMPGGEEFVFGLRGERDATPVVVLNWFETLRDAFEER